MEKVADKALAAIECELRYGQGLSVLLLKICLRDNLVRSGAIWKLGPRMNLSFSFLR